jgi:hypothetical protein
MTFRITAIDLAGNESAPVIANVSDAGTGGGCDMTGRSPSSPAMSIAQIAVVGFLFRRITRAKPVS